MKYAWTDRTDWEHILKRILDEQSYIKNDCQSVYDVHSILEAQKKRQEEFMQKVQKTKYNGGVKKVIFNDPATIVYWSDGDKAVVKCMEGETFNRWTGFAMAVCKKMMCENDPVKFHRWMKHNCGKEEDITSDLDSESSVETFTDSLGQLIADLWDPRYGDNKSND